MKSRVRKIVRFAIFILLFVISSILGIYQFSKETSKYKDYETVIGEYLKSSVYRRNEDSTSYRLTYRYYANGEFYQVTTNYGTGIVPKEGAPRKIRYHKNNPKDAIIIGVELSEWCLLVIFISLIASSYSLQSLIDLKDKKQRDTWDYINLIVIGITMIYASILIYSFITGTKNLFSIFDMLESYGLSLIIVFIFTIVGIFLISYSVYSFFPKKKKVKKDSFEIEQEKLRKEQNQLRAEQLEKNVENFIEKSSIVSAYATCIFRLIVSSIMCFLFVYFFYFKSTNLDFTTFLVLLPFVIVFFSIAMVSLLDLLSLFLKNQKHVSLSTKLQSIFSYLPVVAFLTFWFGFLIFFCISTAKEKMWPLFFFTIPFWIIGIIFAKSLFTKKK